MMEIEYKIKLCYRIDLLEDVLLKLPTIAAPIEGALTTIELLIDRAPYHLLLDYKTDRSNCNAGGNIFRYSIDFPNR
jgi:hypothetical protein